jgi:hypothetical protein
MLVYVITAFCPGPNKERFSYVVAVCDDLDKALRLAEEEEKSRGSRYTCEVTEFTVNSNVWDKPKRKIKR